MAQPTERAENGDGGQGPVRSRVRERIASDAATREEIRPPERRRNTDLLALVDRLRRRDRELMGLHRMYRRLHSCTTRDEVYGAVARTANQVFAGQSGFLAMTSPRALRLDLVARWGEPAPEISSFAQDDCLALLHGRTHQCDTSSATDGCTHLRETSAEISLCVPLIGHDGALGVLCGWASPRDVTARTTMGRRFALVALGESVRASIANLAFRETLQEQAYVDALTGLYNRRYLDDCLARELERARRRRSPVCVAMIDIDHFKRLNDTYGHPAGDAVLREMGRLLLENVRKSDIVCRYGGEEFVLVFPDSTLASTRQRLEQIRRLVKELRFPVRSLGFTVSAGVAQAAPEGSNVKDLLCAADGAMYAAKQAGRDRVAESSIRIDHAENL